MKYNSKNQPLICMQMNSTCYKSTRKMNILGILWHSTGANNPTLKRYIQPGKADINYKKLLNILGENRNKNDYNNAQYQSGVNAWIGKAANGEVLAVQSMPWDFRPWGCGSGKKGSCNNGWIQFEICEDNLNDPNYFNKIYKEGCELTAYLCKIYKIDPNGIVNVNGTKIPTILCHADSYKLGFGSNHNDVLHWFKRYGKNMDTIRADVTKLLQESEVNPPTPPVQPPIITPPSLSPTFTQADFNRMMNVWIEEQSKLPGGDWSKEARDWAEKNNLVKGNNQDEKMYKKLITREEFIVVLYRALHRYFI